MAAGICCIHNFRGTLFEVEGLVCEFISFPSLIPYQSDQPRLTCASTNFEPNDPGGDCDVGDRIALSFFLGVLFAASFSLSRATSNHQYLM